MINPNEKLEMTATSYLSQFVLGDYKYDNYNFYINTGGFKAMFVNKYDGKGYQFSIHPFKVIVIQ